MKAYEIAIIGAGASGLAAAIEAKRTAPKKTVAVFEHLPRVGKKILATGNGRCNVTNRSIEPTRYHGRAPQFVKAAFERFTREDTERVFSDLQTVKLPAFFEKLFRDGCPIYQKKIKTAIAVGERVRIANERGEFFALGEVVERDGDSVIKSVKIFEL